MNSRNEQGIAHLGLIIVVVLVLAVVVFAFWRIQQDSNEEAPTTTETSRPAETEPAIEGEADLEAAETMLLETDIDAELDVSEFDEVIE